MKKYDVYGDNALSGWGYVGRSILWAIPVIGWLIWFTRLWASNASVKGYARSRICWFVLILIVAVIAVAGVAIATLMGIDLGLGDLLTPPAA